MVPAARPLRTGPIPVETADPAVTSVRSRPAAGGAPQAVGTAELIGSRTLPGQVGTITVVRRTVSVRPSDLPVDRQSEPCPHRSAADGRAGTITRSPIRRRSTTVYPPQSCAILALRPPPT